MYGTLLVASRLSKHGAVYAGPTPESSPGLLAIEVHLRLLQFRVRENADPNRLLQHELEDHVQFRFRETIDIQCARGESPHAHIKIRLVSTNIVPVDAAWGEGNFRLCSYRCSEGFKYLHWGLFLFRLAGSRAPPVSGLLVAWGQR